VAQAMLPSLYIGLIAGLIVLSTTAAEVEEVTWTLVAVWAALYGAALHAAGFFMPRGIKMLGWLFILGGCSLTLSSMSVGAKLPITSSHVIMGVFFGGLQLAYGIYLHLSEKPQRTM
jgi:hypothetical protein